jgi:probable H4MPT-linked C1 transfer pathway protein
MNPPPPNRLDWIAFDIGGANIKAANESGQAGTLPFELWKRPDDLPGVIATFAKGFREFGRIALTMTAELCDCYATKAEGVLDVLDAVMDVAGERPVCVWGIDRQFHSPEEIRAEPSLAAASNWLALAEVAARIVPEGTGILIDIGSTTTDLVPLVDGLAVPRGRTDTGRLQMGELVYAGVRRTPICALAAELPFQGLPTGLAAELFASTLDIFLVLGETPEAPGDLSTADGRPATREAARARLARMVGADRSGFTADDAIAFARAAEGVLLDRLESAARRACEGTIGVPRSAVVAGSGEALARRLAARLLGPEGRIIGLRDAWGQVASAAACAWALATLARERAESDLASRAAP